jgi:hypothetical protein
MPKTSKQKFCSKPCTDKSCRQKKKATNEPQTATNEPQTATMPPLECSHHEPAILPPLQGTATIEPIQTTIFDNVVEIGNEPQTNIDMNNNDVLIESMKEFEFDMPTMQTTVQRPFNEPQSPGIIALLQTATNELILIRKLFEQQKTNKIEKLYSVKEFAEYINVNVHNAYKIIETHNIKTINISERSTRIKESEITKYINSIES